MKKGKLFLALALLVGVPLLTYSLSFTVEKRYTAQVRLQVESFAQRADYPNPFSPIDDQASQAKPRSTSTQVQVMTGTEVLGAALQKARENLPSKLRSDESASSAYENLVRRLQIDSDPLSDVVGLRVTQTDPEVAAELANDIAYAYQDYMERKMKSSNQSILTALNHEVSIMKSKLDAIDKETAALETKAKVADTGTAGNSYTAAAVQNEQTVLNARSQYEGAVAELAEAKSLLVGIPKTIVASINTQANPIPIGLETDLTRLRTQLADLQSKFTDEYPDVKAMKQQIKQGEANLKEYATSMSAGQSVQANPAYQQQFSSVLQLQGRVNNLRSTLASLEATSAVAQNKVNDLPAVQQRIDGLLRDRLAMESSYQQLEQRRDVTEAASTSRQPSIQIVSPALVPEAPSFPDARLFVLAGLAVGGFLAILLLMPRQEAPTFPEGYYPASCPPLAEAPTTSRQPVMATATSESSGLEAGTRHDP